MAILSVSKAAQHWLQEDGFKIAREHRDSNEQWPDIEGPLPAKKNHLTLIGRDPITGEVSEETFFATSVRGITVGREIPGGDLGDRYGIVCAGDARNKAEFVIGGGKVQPDFDGTSEDRLAGEDRELVRGAMVAENDEELRFPFTRGWDPLNARDHKLWGDRYFLCGVRLITEDIRDPETKVVLERNFERREGLRCVDVCFLAITHERLGNFEGQLGETKTRYVKAASELFTELSQEERRRGKLPKLNFTQTKMLAFGLLNAKKIFGKHLPDGFQQVLADGEAAATRLMERVRRNRSNENHLNHFIDVVQGAPWVV